MMGRDPQRGFTYLWTLFAVAFMGVGMMVTAELWTTAVKRERESYLIHVGRQFRDAIGRYYESTPGGAKQYPPSLEELIQDTRFPAMRRHLRKVFADPVTGKADWDLVRLNGRVVGVKSRSTDAPIKVAGFELTESSFAGKEKYSEWVFTYPHDLLLRPEGSKTPGMLPGAQPGAQPLNAAGSPFGGTVGGPIGGVPGMPPGGVTGATDSSLQFPPHINKDFQSNETRP